MNNLVIKTDIDCNSVSTEPLSPIMNNNGSDSVIYLTEPEPLQDVSGDTGVSVDDHRHTTIIHLPLGENSSEQVYSPKSWCSPKKFSDRPGSRSSHAQRYINEDHVLKFNLRRDFYCATIWFPYFLQKYYPDLHWSRRLGFSLLIYSNFLFIALIVNFFTILVAGELLSAYQCHDDIFNYRLNPLAVISASVLFLMSQWREFRLSIKPLTFWWKVVSYGNWEFEVVQMPDTSMELVKVVSPFWNCWFKLCLIATTQIVSNLILLTVGLATIYSSDSYLDLVKDCLSLIWITQIDEDIFSYIFEISSHFRNLWRDTVFDETVFVYTDPKSHRPSGHRIATQLWQIVTYLLSSHLGLVTVTLIFHLLFSQVGNILQCMASTTITSQ